MSEEPKDEVEAHEADDAHPRPPSIRDLNVPLILTIGIISVLLLIVAIVGTEAWFRYEMHQEREEKVVQQPFTELEDLNQQQTRLLRSGPAWQNKEKGVVSVPIDQAMQRYIETRGQQGGGDQAGSG